MDGWDLGFGLSVRTSGNCSVNSYYSNTIQSIPDQDDQTTANLQLPNLIKISK